MRRKIIAGNWKMNLKRDESLILTENIINNLPEEYIADIILSPSFTNLLEVYKESKRLLTNKNIHLSIAAQNCSKYDIGSFTGEVSARMIKSSFATHIILGHSERRDLFVERNEDIKQKVNAALNHKLNVIFCCGESLVERDQGGHFKCIEVQLSESLFHLPKIEFENIIIAYEPVWAIGTGIAATATQAQEMHNFLRNLIDQRYDGDIANHTSILYGGSCTSVNAKKIFSQQDIDGGLIGGSSLNAEEFIDILLSF